MFEGTCGFYKAWNKISVYFLHSVTHNKSIISHINHKLYLRLTSVLMHIDPDGDELTSHP
jgi:hypothetical protein